MDARGGHDCACAPGPARRSRRSVRGSAIRPAWRRSAVTSRGSGRAGRPRCWLRRTSRRSHGRRSTRSPTGSATGPSRLHQCPTLRVAPAGQGHKRAEHDGCSATAGSARSGPALATGCSGCFRCHTQMIDGRPVDRSVQHRSGTPRRPPSPVRPLGAGVGGPRSLRAAIRSRRHRRQRPSARARRDRWPILATCSKTRAKRSRLSGAQQRTNGHRGGTLFRWMAGISGRA